MSFTVTDNAAPAVEPAAPTASAASASSAPGAITLPSSWLIAGAVTGAFSVAAITLALLGQQRIKSLEQELVRRQQDSQGQAIEARAMAQQAQEVARAEAEVFMIQAIMEGLENARRAGGAGAMRDVVALRMVEALEKMARQSQQYQPLPDRLMPQLVALQRQLRAERSLPAQQKEGE